MSTTTAPAAVAPAPAANAAKATNAPANGSKVPAYASASLYVGDLSSEVTEGMLFELFNTIGPVASIRVCRDAVTRRSLGYAYVNFHGIADAERALEQLNNTPIKGKLCRIMWSQRDPSKRKSGAGNIFIKNLDKSIDHKTLYDTFSMFGTILSCKVVADANGSKGYGFVHYDSEESAKKAIAKVNNMMLANKTVYVAPFVPKKMRQQAEGEKGPRFTNLYVKNLPVDVTNNDELEKMFAKYGTITSAKLVTEEVTRGALAKRKAELAARKAASAERRKAAEEAKAAAEKAEKEGGDADKKADADKADDADKKDADKKDDKADKAETPAEIKVEVDGDPNEVITVSRGFGFVNFESAEEAQAAVDELNNKELEDGRVMFVGRAQKKAEREQALRSAADRRKAERLSKYQGVNLYVKNLEDTVDDERLRDEFAQFGTITSCRVMRDEKGNSRGFGFVCFATSEEATRAVTEMNSKMIGAKPIYVALAQRKEERRAQLEMQHARRTGRGPKGGMPVAGGAPGVPVPGMYAPNAPVFYATTQQQGFMYPHGQMMPRNAAPRQAWAGAAPAQYPYVVGGVVRGPGGARRGPVPQQQRRVAQQAAPAAQARAAVNNDIAVQMQAMAAAPLDPKRIADLPPDQQKLVLGEKLYPLIHASQPELAGKITGMLLDSYFSEEIIHLIETPDALKAKIAEALAVLEQHAAKQTQ